jgi:hypothetical protein
MSITLRSLAVSVATLVPGIRRLSGRRTGGTVSARYCYSVWLRHLVTLQQSGLPTSFDTVLELGPGDSLGVSLAALLSGANRSVALDVVRYADAMRNLQIFDELVALFRARADIPGETEFPLVRPTLQSYVFPADILTPERLEASLKPARLEAIRAALVAPSPAQPDPKLVAVDYHVPWQPNLIKAGTVDLVLTQSVLEYSQSLPALYAEMAAWLRPGGVMSHEIDFKSFGITREWNGHWACSDFLWRLAIGKRRHLLNREPCSKHAALAEAVGCRVASIERTRRPSDITRAQLTKRFREVTDEDLTTSSALIQVVKAA